MASARSATRLGKKRLGRTAGVTVGLMILRLRFGVEIQDVGS
jgi:hypothetical protein